MVVNDRTRICLINEIQNNLQINNTPTSFVFDTLGAKYIGHQRVVILF